MCCNHRRLRSAGQGYRRALEINPHNERAQAGLASNGNEWVNIQRLYAPAEMGQRNVVTDGTSEWQMRNQFRAWAKFMTMSL